MWKRKGREQWKMKEKSTLALRVDLTDNGSDLRLESTNGIRRNWYIMKRK